MGRRPVDGIWIAVLGRCDCVFLLRIMGLGKERTGIHPASMTGTCGAFVLVGVGEDGDGGRRGGEMGTVEAGAVGGFADGEGWGGGG